MRTGACRALSATAPAPVRAGALAGERRAVRRFAPADLREFGDKRISSGGP